jgi:hypothetical protein
MKVNPELGPLLYYSYDSKVVSVAQYCIIDPGHLFRSDWNILRGKWIDDAMAGTIYP